MRLSASVKFVALTAIDPVVSAARTRSGVNWRSASRLGARLSGPGLSWQIAHRRSNPITCAAGDAGMAGACVAGCAAGDGGCCVPPTAEPKKRNVRRASTTCFDMDMCVYLRFDELDAIPPRDLALRQLVEGAMRLVESGLVSHRPSASELVMAIRPKRLRPTTHGY